MRFLQTLSFSLSICLGLTAGSLHAQQLQQPASIAPWRAPTAKSSLLPSVPVASDSSDLPGWLLDSPQPLPKRHWDRAELPMVEAESFAHLGQLDDDFEHSRKKSVRKTRGGPGRISQPFNLFRALGISMNRSGSSR